jgi:vesicle coat complex subunit
MYDNVRFPFYQAIKRVIAYMTVGKDVSGLFQSVIKCLEFNDIELKKLVLRSFS